MSSLNQIFLEQIANDCFPCCVQTKKTKERAFLTLRFHPENREKQHTDIAKYMCNLLGKGDYTTSIGTICKNVVQKITQQYQIEMTADFVDVDSLLKGTRGQHGAWEKVYTWLDAKKLPRWRSEYIWQKWQNQAQLRSNWIIFSDYSLITKGAKIPPAVVNNRIQINKPLLLQIDLKDEDGYLLLLNRGVDEKGVQTRYLFCPSAAFAPQIKPIAKLQYLPQPGAMSPDIQFDRVGIEEYIGILLKEIPTERLSWLTPTTAEPAPIWDDDRLYQLWIELEQQPDPQLYYQSFNVVNS
jgi:hypothetical protein